jgi:hypothetical protein
MAKRAPVSRYDNLSVQGRQALSHADQTILHEGFKSYIGAPEQSKDFSSAYNSLENELSPFPKLKGPFLLAFVTYSNGTTAQSRRRFEGLTSKLKWGFIAFLKSEAHFDITLSDIDEAYIKAFTAWLKGHKSIRGDSYANATKRKFYGAFLCVLEHLIIEPRFSELISPALRVPPNPFPTTDDEPEATEALDDEEWELLIAACKKEVLETMTLVKQTSDILSQTDSPRAIVKSSERNPFHDYKNFLIALRGKYPAILPTLKNIRQQDSDLHHAIRKIHGGLHTFENGFYPTAPALFPFIFLMYIYTLANRDPLLEIKDSSIREKEVLGVPRVVIRFYKARSHSFYDRSYAIDVNDALSPGRLLEFLERNGLKEFESLHCPSTLVTSSSLSRPTRTKCVGSILRRAQEEVPIRAFHLRRPNFWNAMALAVSRPRSFESLGSTKYANNLMKTRAP